MKLKTKAINILFLLSLVCLACGYLILRTAVLPRFEVLERQKALNDLVRARKAMEQELLDLDRVCRDWAARDDTYRFLMGQDPGYPGVHLQPGTFTGLHLAAIYFLAPDGRVVWGQVRDENGRRVSPPDFAGGGPPVRGITDITKDGRGRHGLVRSAGGPLLFSAVPVTDPLARRPAAGIVFMAQRFDQATLERIRSLTLLPFEAILLPPGARGRGRTVTCDAERMIVSDTVNDHLGRPMIELRASFPRQISMTGRRTVRTVMFVSLITAVAIIIFSMSVLDRLVISPIEAMSDADGTDRAERLATIAADRGDEVGRLAGKLAELEERWERHAQDEASISWDSGAREMAAGLLHNIRNTINPAFSDMSLVREEMAAIPIGNMRKALEELAAAEGERREMLTLYLERAMDIIEDFILRLEERLRGVRSRCHEIELMISAHAGTAEHGARRASTFPLKTLVEAAVEVIPARLRGRVTVEMDPSLARRISAPRIELLQVVQNLVKNAVEAIETVERDNGRIRISAGEDGEQLWIRVEDNGCGIDPDDLENIFRRDFSTSHPARPGAGTGLHWCANTCRNLGGRLAAASGGPGKGACFTVFLPLNPHGQRRDDGG